jgi:energy-coupling factor transporter ATP-binding protein EcfA2
MGGLLARALAMSAAAGAFAIWGTVIRGESLPCSDVNLTSPERAEVGILGANGSGKTTLLLHLNGTFRPTAGRNSAWTASRPAYDRRSLDSLAAPGRVGVAGAG